ncbi:recombinase family protein [Methylobacterium brachythecii]|uniref:DNA invertase Pin-like site-specific DNA recombinase n=1 Tax=Methylobacterium brachythecii TaxID=1176177 RepID=A0A7W6F6S0_9HYPH|nr:recombinase family protein [Methylobacterium brachythecii]MBB3902722.1 DNA invertase Pin-like site-specific DNA recombinase [Methylobacterium brachythecii]GLS42566.1 hypothetical protein GCM10007884_05510 [Methylobacterium brachythecii]
MKRPSRPVSTPPSLRCAIYTRVSTDHGLEQEFNSLDNQREAAEAYVKSQAHEGWRVLPDRFDDGGFSGGSLERPALQRLLAEVVAGRIDVIVVYKVDRLTRALADFAKLVELFDEHDVSFVSVTQAFNTTSCMGRLTLNVLLSFAQFERELTGERIRDKIAASKRKGIWMGGVVPLGYRVEARALHVVPEHAALIRLLYERYLSLGSVCALASDLAREGVHAPDRREGTGGRVRGGPFSRGHLYQLLSSRVYLGKITHRGASHPGQHAAIIEPELFAAVAERLAANTRERRQIRSASGALLGGLLFDASGRAMSPSHTRKGGLLYRYYVSRALLRGRARDVTDSDGPLRVPAVAIEQAVTAALQTHLNERSLAVGPIEQWIDRVVVQAEQMVITLRADAVAEDEQDSPLSDTLIVPWTAHRPRGSASVVLPGSPEAQAHGRKPMPHDVRRHLLASIARARAWKAALMNGAAADVDTLARSARCSERHVRMLLPLADLAPDLVQAAHDGALPAGYGAARLCRGLPVSWSEQRKLIPLMAWEAAR